MENIDFNLSSRGYGKSFNILYKSLLENGATQEELQKLKEAWVNNELDEFWNSEEGRLTKGQLLQNFKDYVIYGKRN